MIINDEGEKKQLTKDEAEAGLQIEILDSLKEVNDLLPELGHGEAKRLLLATLSYPLETQDFVDETVPMKKAYSACKRITDAMIALGVEVTLETMLKQQMEAQSNEENGENNG
jgi:hypothetical protein